MKEELEKVKAELRRNRAFAEVTVSRNGHNLERWFNLTVGEIAEAVREARSVVSCVDEPPPPGVPRVRDERPNTVANASAPASRSDLPGQAQRAKRWLGRLSSGCVGLMQRILGKHSPVVGHAKAIRELERASEVSAKEIVSKTSGPMDLVSKVATALRLSDEGVHASRAGDVTKALGCFKAAIRVDSRCRNAYYNMGWEYTRLGEELHKPFMGKVTALTGKEFAATVHPRWELYDRAIANLRRSVQITPDHAASWYLLGKTYYYLHHYDEARRALRRAIEIDRDGPDGRLAQEALSEIDRIEAQH